MERGSGPQLRLHQQGAVSPQRENPNVSKEPGGQLFEGTGVVCVRQRAWEGVRSA